VEPVQRSPERAERASTHYHSARKIL
jgi:hypothetical protein